MGNIRLLCSIFISLVLMIGFVNATPTNIDYTLEELTENAVMIFTGNVENIEYGWNEDNTQINTFVTISIDEMIKGNAPENNTITIKQMGGSIDGVNLYIVDSPQFVEGEELLIFVRPDIIPIVGLSQGKFTIGTEEGTGKKIVLENQVYLDDFLEDIRNIINSPDGQPLLLSSRSTPLNLIQSNGGDSFRIFGPNFGPGGDFVTVLGPMDKPPFLHWDLREFKDCKVPWSISNFTTDLDEDGDVDADDNQLAFNELRQTFGTWEDVTPSAIGFIAGDRFVTNRAIRLDSYNTLDWANATAVTGDDVQAIDVGNGTPNSIIITPGPNGFINTTPAGDDKVSGNNIISGLNGVSETTAAVDDDQVIPSGQGLANSIAVTVGANGFLETQPLGDDVLDLTNNRVTSGPDGIVQTPANNQYSPDYVALTGVFFDKNGRIIESDILFNSNLNWTIGLENSTADLFDVRVTASHEIGHLIGIAHSPVAGPPVPTMHGTDWPDNLSKRTLEDSDKNAANFLYTPDLGDAPDPYTGFNQYPSKVHDGAGRTLSGVPLLSPAKGAEHLFGYQPSGFAYEWLGDIVEGPGDSSECEAKLVNKDEHDDGVRFVNFNATPGATFDVIVNVSTSGEGAARYGADDKLYLNAWIDWDADGRWSLFEKIIAWEGGPGLNDSTAKGTLVNPANPWNVSTDSRDLRFKVTVPSYTISSDRLGEPFYSRFRLDYDENVGAVNNIDGTLDQDKGAAQLGEVEDYVHMREKPVPAMTTICLIMLIGLLSVVAISRIRRG